MGVHCCRPRKGGFWGKDGQEYKKRKLSNAPLSAVPNSRNSKTENFLFLFEKNLGARHQKNVEKIFLFWDANFFKVCGRKRGGG